MATEPVELELLPETEAIPPHLEDAARQLEQAIKAGAREPEVAYLLALCYKRMGKVAEAMNALRKIPNPDANVLLQMGILALQGRQYAEADQHFARALQADANSYEACYNLLLSRLALGRFDTAAALLPQIQPLAPTPEDRRFFGLFEPLLQVGRNLQAGLPPPLPRVQPNGQAAQDAGVPQMTADDERRLLKFIHDVGPFEVIFPLMRTLAAACPNSPAVQEAYLESALVQARKLADRCQWDHASELLTPLTRFLGDAGSVSRKHQVALLTLLGVCECMLQDYDRGARYFSSAVSLSPNDPWLHQNLALAFELQGRLDQADAPWNRYFDLLDGRVPAAPVPHYLETLAFEGLSRLADLYARKERFQHALPYLQRAHRLRPQDADSLERLFHLYNQVKRPEEARRALKRLRELKPHEPQFELYELDLREVRTLEDIDRMLGDIRRTLTRYPGDMRVEERAVGMVANVVPLMGRMCDQLTEQLNKIAEQVRRLPNYQINWPAVREVMRDLHDEFAKLKRITTKCLGLVTHEEQRRIIRDLSDHIDRKIELCQSMGA